MKNLVKIVFFTLILTACTASEVENTPLSTEKPETPTEAQLIISTEIPTTVPTATRVSRTYEEITFGLKLGFHIDTLLKAPVGDLFTVAASETGYIYGQSFNSDKPGIYVYDPNTKQVNYIRDNAGGMDIIEGPGDAIFIRSDRQTSILLLYPDGSTETWAYISENIRPLHYIEDGRLIGTYGSTTLIEIFQDGTYEIISDDFQEIANVGLLLDGSYVVSEAGVDNGRISRIDPDGYQEIIFRGGGNTQFYLEVNSEGRLFVNSNQVRFAEIDPYSGNIVRTHRFGYSGGYCGNAFGFSFLDANLVAFGSFSLGTFYIGNLEDETVEYIYGNFTTNNALAAGNDEELFVISGICKEDLESTVEIKGYTPLEGFRSLIEFPIDEQYFHQSHSIDINEFGDIFILSGNGHIGKFDQAKNEFEVIFYPQAIHNNQAFESLAVHPTTSTVYVAYGDGNIFSVDQDGNYVEHNFSYPEELGHIRITVTEDGKIYAIGGDHYGYYNGPSTTMYILEIDPNNNSSEIVYTWNQDGSTGDGFVDVDSYGNIWYMITSGVYQLQQDGTTENYVSSRGYGGDAGGFSINSDSDIYVSGPNGIFRIYEED